MTQRQEEAMTPAERKIIELTADLWNQFAALDRHHPMDLTEMSRDIHNIQQRVMCRSARREYPELFVTSRANDAVLSRQPETTDE